MKTIDSFKRWCKEQPRKKLVYMIITVILNLIVIGYSIYIELQTT